MPAIKKKRGAPKGSKKHQPHRCTDRCRHTCGELGGKNRRGKPCGRLGGWGDPKIRNGRWALCREHARDQVALRQTKQPGKGEYAFEGDLQGRDALFVDYYCGSANCNATQAADDAGFAPGADRTVHQVQGSNMLRKPQVRAAILKRFNERSASGEEVLKRITDDARIDIAGLITFDDDGNPVLKLTEEALKVYGTLIKEIEFDTKGRVSKIKLNDSQAARHYLARIRQLLSDSPTINIFNLQELSNEEVSKRLMAAKGRLTLRHYHGNGEEGA